MKWAELSPEDRDLMRLVIETEVRDVLCRILPSFIESRLEEMRELGRFEGFDVVCSRERRADR